jgi:alkylhydroperoxidase family enzyme
VCRDLATAPVSAAERALLGYVEKLTLAPATCGQADVDALKAHGWDDEAIFDAVTVTALFSFFNRWIDGNGVADTPPGLYAERLKAMGDFKYA